MNTAEYFEAMDRVLDEAAELGKKIGRLNAYLASSPAISADMIKLLGYQLDAMRAYEVILVKRIAAYVGILIPGASST